MAKKKKNDPTNILTMMYQEGYRKGYAEGVKKGKKLILDSLDELATKKDDKK